MLASETIEAMRAQLPEVTTLELAVERKLEPAFGDRDRLQQVLVNLLDNAVKYSPDGGRSGFPWRAGPDACVFGDRSGARHPDLAEQQRVFEKFYRLDTQLTRAGGGTGLGLYITRELVRRMGGRIGVRSEPGVGSTFTVDLPRARSPRIRRACASLASVVALLVLGLAAGASGAIRDRVLQPYRRLLHLRAEERRRDQARPVRTFSFSGPLPAMREADCARSDL